MESEAARCANCNAELIGQYCHGCGQSVADPVRSFRVFVTESLGDIAHLRSGTLLTLGTLFKPGRLTREYLVGRRARYIGPLQVYLLAAAVFFMVSTIWPVVEFQRRDSHDSQQSRDHGDGRQRKRWGSCRPGKAWHHSARFRGAVASHVNGTLPVFLILSLFVFVLIMRIIYIRQPFTIVGHAVFALHWSAFYLLVLVAERLTRPLGTSMGLHGAVALIGLIYLVIALRHVYRQSMFVTLLKGLTIWFLFNVVLAVWVFSVVSLAMATI